MAYLFGAQNGSSSVEFDVDGSLFDLEAVTRAAYSFTGDNYVQCAVIPETGAIRVRIASKREAGKVRESLADEFQNELLHSVLRKQVADSTRHVREMIMARALFSVSIDLDEVPVQVDMNHSDDVGEERSRAIFTVGSDSEGIAKDWFE